MVLPSSLVFVVSVASFSWDRLGWEGRNGRMMNVHPFVCLSVETNKQTNKHTHVWDLYVGQRQRRGEMDYAISLLIQFRVCVHSPLLSLLPLCTCTPSLCLSLCIHINFSFPLSVNLSFCLSFSLSLCLFPISLGVVVGQGSAAGSNFLLFLFLSLSHFLILQPLEEVIGFIPSALLSLSPSPPSSSSQSTIHAHHPRADPDETKNREKKKYKLKLLNFLFYFLFWVYENSIRDGALIFCICLWILLWLTDTGFFFLSYLCRKEGGRGVRGRREGGGTIWWHVTWVDEI